MREKALRCLVLVAIVGLWALPASASLLDTGTPYQEGTKIWCGTTVFPEDYDPVLGGYVEWAVYESGHFPGTFSGYTPTPGQFAYVYQVFSTGSAPITI